MDVKIAEGLRKRVLNGDIPPGKHIPKEVNLNDQTRIRQFIDTEPKDWKEGLLGWIKNTNQETITFLGVEEILLRQTVT